VRIVDHVDQRARVDNGGDRILKPQLEYPQQLRY
jgi:hypothetical protein